jgi:hypothetical protein
MDKTKLGDCLLKDYTDVEITEATKNNPGNKLVRDIRISTGMYRTDKEKRSYLKESLERELP